MLWKRTGIGFGLALIMGFSAFSLLKNSKKKGDLVPSSVHDLGRQEIDLAIKKLENQATPANERNRTQRIVTDAFLAIMAARNRVFRDDMEETIFSKLQSDPAMVAEAQSIASDLDYAISNYGDQQAEMRYLSLRFLKHLAKDGSIEPMENVLAQIGKNLNAKDRWEKAIDDDFVDLMAQYIRSVGPEEILRNPQEFVERFGLTRKTVDPFAKAAHDSGLMTGKIAEEFRQKVVPLIDPSL